MYPERITKTDRRIVNYLYFVDIKFPVLKKIIVRLNRRIAFAWMYFEDCIDLLLITDENKSHYVYTKDRFMCNKTKSNKKPFWRYFWQCFSSEKVLQEHKKVCLKINGKQSVKLRSGSIKFKIISSN